MSLLVLACGGADAPVKPTDTVTIFVDAAGASTPLERVWPFFGYDEVNYTTDPAGQALLHELVAANTAPVQVRNHFLFNTGDGSAAPKWGSTNVYTEDATGSPVYDWTLTDRILEALTAAGAAPFVELGFMPQALSVHPKPYENTGTLGLNGGCFFPPSDYQKWGNLVGSWASHVREQYPEQAPSWLWELWNEPDSGYWHGSFDEYARLYDFTEAALHDAIPEAALGGPAVIDPSGSFLTRFLEHCARGSNAVSGSVGTRLDLVSFHAKGGAAVTDGHVELNLGHQLQLHRDGFAAVAAFPEFRHTPIYISEADPDGCAACDATLVSGAEYRTSTAYGAYELAMMKRSLELEERLDVNLRGVVTWAFTFPGTPYFAGYRELASHGVHLPVLAAFQLLGRLAGQRVSLESSGALSLDELLESGVRGRPDIDGLATRDGESVQVLVWNYHDALVAAEPAAVRLAVQLPASFGARALVSHLRVDEGHGDAHALWVSQGRPDAPTPAQLAALREGMVPSRVVPDSTAMVKDGSVSVQFELPRFGVSLVTISPANDTNPERGK